MSALQFMLSGKGKEVVWCILFTLVLALCPFMSEVLKFQSVNMTTHANLGNHYLFAKTMRLSHWLYFKITASIKPDPKFGKIF